MIEHHDDLSQKAVVHRSWIATTVQEQHPGHTTRVHPTCKRKDASLSDDSDTGGGIASLWSIIFGFTYFFQCQCDDEVQKNCRWCQVPNLNAANVTTTPSWRYTSLPPGPPPQKSLASVATRNREAKNAALTRDLLLWHLAFRKVLLVWICPPCPMLKIPYCHHHTDSLQSITCACAAGNNLC